MKIALKVTVEMTPDQAGDYCLFAGVEDAEIREDVRRYVETTLQGSPAFYEIGAGVTVRRSGS